jgi:hypothetical protein
VDDGQSRKNGILDLRGIIASAHPVSLIMKNILDGFENSGIWPFSKNAFSDEDFKVGSVVCVGSNEPSVPTAWSVCLISSMSQVGSSLEKKGTPEEVRLYPRAAHNVSRSDGQLKGKLRIYSDT